MGGTFQHGALFNSLNFPLLVLPRDWPTSKPIHIQDVQQLAIGFPPFLFTTTVLVHKTSSGSSDVKS